MPARSFAHCATLVLALTFRGLAVGSGAQVPLGLDAYMPVPDDNPLTPARIALGRRLFFEARLSQDERLACATCHNPARAFADARPTSVGLHGRAGHRNVPALINRGYGASFFWDGRAPSLEAQVLQPIDNPRELGAGVGAAMARLAGDADYERAFIAAFGRAINRLDLARALAAYVRSIRSGGSRFDEYAAGRPDALTAEARLGLRLFRGKANCSACHVGPTFTDERIHNTGVAWRHGALSDPGRAVVTGRSEDRGGFKTPTLREIARTAPYMHDGSIATLADVIAFYDGGGHPNPALDAEIRPLRLTHPEQRAIEVFLHSLSGTIVEGPAVEPRRGSSTTRPRGAQSPGRPAPLDAPANRSRRAQSTRAEPTPPHR